MPHTYPWNVTDPPGSEQAKNIDDHIRKLRVQFNDMLADIVKDINADPLALKDPYTGAKIGKQMLIPFAAFGSSTNGKEYVISAGVLNAFSDTNLLVAPVTLAPGAKITKVEMLMDAGDTSGVTWYLYGRNFAAGGSRPGSQNAAVALVTITQVGAGVQLTSSQALSLTVDGSTLYYIGVDGLGPAGNSFDIYGARITYDVPDSQTTL